MCASMADIQSATAEIRRGKKEERKHEPSASAMQGGHKKCSAVAEMGDRLATIGLDSGRTMKAVPL